MFVFQFGFVSSTDLRVYFIMCRQKSKEKLQKIFWNVEKNIFKHFMIIFLIITHFSMLFSIKTPRDTKNLAFHGEFIRVRIT